MVAPSNEAVVGIMMLGALFTLMLVAAGSFAARSFEGCSSLRLRRVRPPLRLFNQLSIRCCLYPVGRQDVDWTAKGR